MGHDKLANHYKTNFALMQHHKWPLSHLETIMPWERYIYIDLLFDYLREEEKKAQLKAQEIKAEYASIMRRINANKNR